MSTDVFDIAIVGRGPVAVVAALALARGLPGAAIGLVIGRAKAVPAADVRAFALSAGSVNLCRALGLWPYIEPHAQAVARIDIADADLDSPVRRTALSYDNALASGDPASWIVPAETLTVALNASLAGATVTAIARGVTGFTADAHGAALEFDDGTSIRARLALAADGRNSLLRDKAGIQLVGWDYPQTALVTRVRHERPHEGVARQHFLPAGPFAILPLRGGHTSAIVWTETTDAAARILALEPAAALVELELRFGGVLGRLEAEGPMLPWPLRMHLVRRFIGQRLAVMGDAARSVHPIAGQGLNLGLRDVAALTDVLVDATRLGLDIGAGDVLERYEKWRRFDSVSSSATMDGLNRVFSTTGPIGRAMRGVGVGLVDRLPRVKDFLVAEAGGATGKVPRLLRAPRR